MKEQNVRELLEMIGEDPDREGLLETPKRYIKAFKELCSGYDADPEAILSKHFASDADQMVVVHDIKFHSLCEHHLLPFSGVATVAYIPGGRVVGLSKIPRVVEAYTRRLQIQEQLTQQIADAVSGIPNCKGAGVMINSHHSCMGMRGVRCQGSMRTVALVGCFREADVKSEFLSVARDV